MTQSEAIKILYDNTPIEIIYDGHETPDYFEFIGECGGDALRYRVYKKDGKVYSK